jgi:hypothetical protein
MKICCSIVFPLLLCASLWGQANPNPAPVPQPNQAAIPTGVQNRPLSTADVTTARFQLYRQLALENQQMRLKLDEMKTNDAKIKDPALRKHMQLDAELWDLMFSHMNEVTSALLQLRPTSRPDPTAQMYRRQMLQQRMGGAPAATPTPAQPAPAQSQPPAPATARSQP